jgi:hypothetical protein
MSTVWQELRTGIVVADLATTDTNIEALQVAPATLAFASPAKWRGNSSEMVTKIAVMVLAYDGGGAIVAGNCTIQVIEEAQDPKVVTTTAPGKLYACFAPVTSHPYGRIYSFDSRYTQKFTVRLSSASAGTTLRVLWRPFDADR